MNTTLKHTLSAVLSWGRKLATVAFLGLLCVPQGWAHEIVLEWNRYWGIPRLCPTYQKLLKVDNRIYIGGKQSTGQGGSFFLLGEINQQMDGFDWEVTYGDSLHSIHNSRLHYFDNQIVGASRTCGEGGNDDNLRMLFRYLDLNGDSLDGFELPLQPPRGGPWCRASFIDADGNLDLFIVSAADGAYYPFQFWRINQDHEFVFDRVYDGEVDFGNAGFDYGQFDHFNSVTRLSDGDYILTGEFDFAREYENRTETGEADCILRLDRDGDLVWLDINPDSLQVGNHYAFNHQGYLNAALEHSSGFIYATGTTDLYSPPYHAITLYKYAPDGMQLWRRLYNDNYSGFQSETKLYRIIELRSDILALFGHIKYRPNDEREQGLYVALVDTAGEMLTDLFVRGERINDISARFVDILQIDSTRVLALTESFNRVLSIRFDFDDEIVDDDYDTQGPYSFILNPAYPNPFNSSTTITCTLPTSSNISLSIYNMRGQLVDVLLDRAISAGRHSVLWDAGNATSGVYIVRLCSSGKEIKRKVVLTR